MKVVRFAALGLAACMLLAAGPAPAVRVPQNQIDAENARWQSLGVKLPPGGIVLPHPYAAPYSNRSFVVPSAWYRDFAQEMKAKGTVTVDAAQLRADLPVLRFLLQKTYAGYESAEQRGWNWNSMFREWDAQLRRDGNTRLSLTQAFAPWGRLEAVQLDNESGIPDFKAFTSGSVSAVLAASPQLPCTAIQLSGGGTVRLSAHDAGEQPHNVQAWNGRALQPAWYMSYPKRLGAARSVECSGKRIELSPAAQVAAPSQVPVYRMIGNGIAYLRLPTFTDANDEALRAVLSKASDLGKERVVVFDLRGNQGGSAPSDILTNWFAESAVEIAQSISQNGSASCFATALQFGLQQQFTAGLKPPVSAGLQQVLQQLVNALEGQSTPNCSVQAQSQNGDRSLSDHHFTVQSHDAGQTRVIALVDGACASECEYMTYVLSGLPDTVIAGTSTFGVMGFSQPGYFVLPRTRVPFRLALSRSDPYGDGRSVDGYGISVDVLLPTSQSQSTQSIASLADILSR